MFKIDSHVKPPRIKVPKKLRTPPQVHSAYKAYGEAYKRVYGVSPTGFTYDVATKFIHVGNSAGVSVQRLKEMTRQLTLRAG